MKRHTVEFIDRELEAKVAPDPRYPDGIDLDIAKGAKEACLVDLPYPAPRVGFYVVECTVCKMRVMLTVAGRRDDPRSLKMPCKRK